MRPRPPVPHVAGLAPAVHELHLRLGRGPGTAGEMESGAPGKCSSAESGLLIEVSIFAPSNVAFLSSLWTKLAEIWYTFNLTYGLKLSPKKKFQICPQTDKIMQLLKPKNANLN